MLRYVARRLVIMLVTLFVIISLTWFMSQLLPGTPFADEKLSDSAREQLYAKYGLDDPLPVQYVRYMFNVVQGTSGTPSTSRTGPLRRSSRTGRPYRGSSGFRRSYSASYRGSRSG